MKRTKKETVIKEKQITFKTMIFPVQDTEERID